jgi:hypothetical protein
METNLPEPRTPSLGLDDTTLTCLGEIRRWSYFLSVVGFVGIGLVILFGLFLGSFMGNYLPESVIAPAAGLLSMAYLIVGVIYIFPVLYLYRFSVNLKISLSESNQANLSIAFLNLRSLFRFMGVATIVVISLYLVVFLTAIIFTAVSRG